MTQLTQNHFTPPLPRVGAGAFREMGERVHLLRGALATTPGQIRLAMAGIWVLALVFACATWLALDRHRQDMQTIGRDSAPSIIAAESIKWNFADLHGNVIRRFLGSPQQASDAAAAVHELRTNVTNQLLVAAENITYGDAERTPIRDLMNGMASYDDAVAQAVALHDHYDGTNFEHIRDAEQIASGTIIPAAEALDKANQAALDNGYTEQRTAAGHATALLIVTGVMLLAALAGVQILMQRRTHRWLSPALAAAALLTLGWTCWIVTAVTAETHDLKVVKEDAFDSIGVMWRARADAFCAQSHLSLSLLDPTVSRAARESFDRETSRLAALPDGVTFDQVQNAVSGGGLPPAGFQGCIGVELRNITFDGEQDAANQMLARFAHYKAVAERVREAQSSGNRAAAIALCLGDGNDQARGALKAFDEALNHVLEINQQAFDQAVERGFQDVGGFGPWNIGVALAIAILTYTGLSPRLREYTL